MAELSLYLTNVNISLGQAMENKSPEGVKEFECVELYDLGEGGVRKTERVRVPRRTIYFASGETMEEYSTDEEEEEEEPVKKDLLTIDPSKLTWGPYFWFHMWRMATSTVSVCDYLGERMASMFGITSPKYQYAIDEYYRMKKEEEEEEEDNRLSEEAERKFTEQQQQNRENLSSTRVTEQPASFVNLNFELEPEPPLAKSEDDNRVPSPIPS